MNFKRSKTILALLATVTLISACDEKEVTETVETPEQVELNEVAKTNLAPTLITFLEARSKLEGQAVKTIITDNFDSVTGVYAYGAKVLEYGKGSVTLNLGISDLRVPENKIVAHKNFLNTITELKEGAEGLAVVTYKDNIVVSVEFRELEHNAKTVRSALTHYDETKFKAEAKEVKVEDPNNPYKDTTIDDWKGMALLTSREVLNKGMAPIFLVPKNSFSAEELLTDTFYYIVVGTLKSSNANETQLVTDTGTVVSFNAGQEVTKEQLNKPSWVHIITNNSKIHNVEIQTFNGASIENMSDGVRSYIEVSSVLSSPEESGE